MQQQHSNDTATLFRAPAAAASVVAKLIIYVAVMCTYALSSWTSSKLHVCIMLAAHGMLYD
jgi:hypothetical protein